VKLNREILIGAIIRHQKVFFNMLDYIDQHDGSLEIPEQLYINDYNRIICMGEGSDELYLNIPTLVENGVFIHHDKNSGMITVERVIIDLLRFLDIKRAKELTDADFEQMRAQLVSAVNHVMAQPLDSQPYIDALSTFNNLMSEIHSKVKENVYALTAQVDSLAQEYKLYDSGSQQVNVSDLYNKVSDLYDRFVLPCYEFINPSMDMVQTESFSKSVQTLSDYYAFGEIKRYDMANKIQLKKTVITSYYKDIALLTKKLEQFSSHLKKDRSYFLAMESAYSELLNSIIPLRHGRKKNKYLTVDSNVFNNHKVLDGLSSQKYKFSKRLTWDNQTKLRFKEYLVTVQEKDIRPKNTVLRPLAAANKLDQNRLMLISKILYAAPNQTNIPNVHEFIFKLLNEALEDFSLLDILYGIEAILPMYKTKLPSKPAQYKMDDGIHYLDYLQIEYKKEPANV